MCAGPVRLELPVPDYFRHEDGVVTANELNIGNSQDACHVTDHTVAKSGCASMACLRRLQPIFTSRVLRLKSALPQGYADLACLNFYNALSGFAACLRLKCV